jgi:hypothetical protein
MVQETRKRSCSTRADTVSEEEAPKETKPTNVKTSKDKTEKAPLEVAPVNRIKREASILLVKPMLRDISIELKRPKDC